MSKEIWDLVSTGSEKLDSKSTHPISHATYIKVNCIHGVVSFETTTNKKEQVTKKELRRIFK